MQCVWILIVSAEIRRASSSVSSPAIEMARDLLSFCHRPRPSHAASRKQPAQMADRFDLRKVTQRIPGDEL